MSLVNPESRRNPLGGRQGEAEMGQGVVNQGKGSEKRLVYSRSR